MTLRRDLAALKTTLAQGPQAQVSLWDAIVGAADPTELSGYHAELWARLVEIEASGPPEDPIAQRLREHGPNP